NKAELLTQMGKKLEDRHRRGLRTVLIIDEAHELSDFVLEEIRLLMNFESDNAKHLQIVLTGQPELRDKLNQPNLRQLKQRVALRCKMHSLPNVEEVERYITERLLIAGSEQPNIFTPGAIDYVYQCSEGIPRLINNLCDNSMLSAYASGDLIIGRRTIETVADNLDLLPYQEEVLASEETVEEVGSSRVLRPDAREELWNNQSRVERVEKKSAFKTEIPKPKGNPVPTKPASNGKIPFDDLDDEINLEIEEVGGFY
ncbi:MAG: AAA family ATPase, partial [Pyrinomonadaceae bacterium]|nr:AAA family ATPase [Pyrinomonadaceae bacterium]